MAYETSPLRRYSNYRSTPGPTDAERQRMLGEGEFMKGTRRSVAQSAAGSYADEALAREKAGDPNYMESLARAKEIERRIQEAYPQRVPDLRNIKSLEDAIDYASGTIGQGAMTMIPPILGALATRGRGIGRMPNLRASAGAAYPAYQMEHGEATSRQYSDPALRAAPAEDRSNVAAGKAGVNMLLESVVPGALATSFFRKPTGKLLNRTGRELVEEGLTEPTGKLLNHMGREFVEEGLTETAQELVGHGAERYLNPEAELDPWDLANAFAGGALTGGAMSGAMRGSTQLANRVGEMSAPQFTIQDSWRRRSDRQPPPPPGPRPVDSGPTISDRVRDTAKKVTDPVSQAVERMRAAAKEATGPKDFFNRAFGEGLLESAQADLEPTPNEALRGSTVEQTAENMRKDELDRAARAERYAQELVNDPNTPAEVVDLINSKLDSFSSPEYQSFLAKSFVQQFGDTAVEETMDRIEPLLDEMKKREASASSEQTPELLSEITNALKKGWETGKESVGNALERIYTGMDSVLGKFKDTRAEEMYNKAKQQVNDLVAAGKDTEAFETMNRTAKAVVSRFEDLTRSKKNLQHTNPEEQAAFRRHLFNELTDKAKVNPRVRERLDDIANMLIAFASKTGDITPRDISTLTGVSDASTLFKDPKKLAERLNAYGSGEQTKGSFIDRIKRIQNAQYDIRQPNSFLYASMTEEAKDNMTQPQLNQLAKMIDNYTSGNYRYTDKLAKDLTEAMIPVFGNKRNAQLVLDFYYKQNKLDAGTYDPEETRQDDGSNVMNEVEKPPPSYMFKDAKAKRPFSRIRATVRGTREAQQAGIDVRGGTIGNKARADAVPYSQYVAEHGLDPMAEVKRLAEDIKARMAEHQRHKGEDRKDQINKLEGELYMMREAYRRGGAEEALNLFEVLQLSDAKQDMAATDEDLSKFATLVGKRDAQDTRITFQREDGSKLLLSAESMWKTMGDKEGSGKGEPTENRMRRLFADAVTSVLEREDISSLLTPLEGVALDRKGTMAIRRQNALHRIRLRRKTEKVNPELQKTKDILDNAVEEFIKAESPRRKEIYDGIERNINNSNRKAAMGDKLAQERGELYKAAKEDVDRIKYEDAIKAKLKENATNLKELKARLDEVVEEFETELRDVGEYSEDRVETIKDILRQNVDRLQARIDWLKQHKRTLPAQAVMRKRMELYKEALYDVRAAEIEYEVTEKERKELPEGIRSPYRTRDEWQSNNKARRYEEDTGLPIGSTRAARPDAQATVKQQRKERSLPKPTGSLREKLTKGVVVPKRQDKAKDKAAAKEQRATIKETDAITKKMRDRELASEKTYDAVTKLSAAAKQSRDAANAINDTEAFSPTFFTALYNVVVGDIVRGIDALGGVGNFRTTAQKALEQIYRTPENARTSEQSDMIIALEELLAGKNKRFNAEESAYTRRERTGAVKPQLQGTSPRLAEDQRKSDLANKFIGRGSPQSRTKSYADSWGNRANTGKYSASDNVFVSAEEQRQERVLPDFKEIKKAIDAGATIITDSSKDRHRPVVPNVEGIWNAEPLRNTGEIEVADFLKNNGYAEYYGNGIWRPDNKKTKKAPSKPAEPVAPAKPVTPAKPAEPTRPAEPVAPAKPAEPVESVELAKPQLRGNSPYLAKDQRKSDLANKFIGRGSPRSSTAAYAESWGDRANTGKYSSEDTVFVSTEGQRAGRIAPSFGEIKRAINAGATLVTDNINDRNRPYNVGERAVATFLTNNGYVESNGNGIWKPFRKGNEKARVGAVVNRVINEFTSDAKKAEEASNDFVDIIKSLIGDVADIVVDSVDNNSRGLVASFSIEETNRAVVSLFIDTLLATNGEADLYAYHEGGHAIVQMLHELEGRDVAKKVIDKANTPAIRKQVAEYTGINSAYYLTSPEELFVHAFGMWATGKLTLPKQSKLAQIFEAIKKFFNKATSSKSLNEIFSSMKAGDFINKVQTLSQEKMIARFDASGDFISYNDEFVPSAKHKKELIRILKKQGVKINPDVLNSKGAFTILRNMALTGTTEEARNEVIESIFPTADELDAELKEWAEKYQPILLEKVKQPGIKRLAALFELQYEFDLFNQELGRQETGGLEQRSREDERAETERYFREEKERKDAERERIIKDAVSSMSIDEINQKIDSQDQKIRETQLKRRELNKRYENKYDNDEYEKETRKLSKEEADEKFLYDAYLEALRLKEQGTTAFSKINELTKGENITKEQQQAIIDEIARIRGKDVAVLFDTFAKMGASGEHRRVVTDDGIIKRLIRIAVDAVNPMSVAWHESLHDFFTMLDDTPSHRQLKKDLIKIANQPQNVAVLRELLKDYPAALAQVNSSAEERLAYLYQFWAEGALKLSNPGNNILAKISNFFNRMLGIVTQNQKVDRLFEALHAGKLSNPNTVMEVLKDLNVQTTYERARNMSGPIGDAASKMFTSATDRLRNTNIPALMELADKFNLDPGRERSGELPFLQRRAQSVGKNLNRIQRILDNTTAEQRRIALDNLQNMKKPRTELEKELSAYLQDMWKYMDSSNVKTFGKDGKWHPLNFVENYFPRFWDKRMIETNKKEFVNLLKKYVGEEQAYESYNALISGDGSLELAENQHTLGFTPWNPNVLNRQFTFIDPSNAHLFSKFQVKDLAHIMTTYTQRAVHRAEYAKSFGNNAEVIEDLMAKAYAQGATTEDIAMAHKATMGLEGTLGFDFNPRMKEVMSGIMTYENIILLPLALFTNLVDPLGVGLRSNSIKEAGKAFVYGIKGIADSIIGNKDDEATELAKTLGLIDDQNMLDAMGHIYNSMYMSRFMKKINNKFFKYNGMEVWNQRMRVAAMMAAQRFIIKNIDDKRYMNELGLKPSDVFMLQDGRIALTKDQLLQTGAPESEVTALEKRLQAAVFKWVDSAVVRPNAAQRPIWGSDPRYQLIFHLKQFTFSFHNVIMKRVREELRHGNTYPAVMLASYMPFMLASDIARGTLTGTIGASSSLYDIAMNSLNRSGMLGIGSFGDDVLSDASKGRIPGSSFLGPAFGHAKTVADFVFGKAGIESLMNRSLPLYRYF